MLKVNLSTSLLMLAIVLWASATAFGQGTAFTYQGRLTDNNNPADGTYDMQFKLFDGVGNQQGSTITNSMVEVTNGVFSVQLDFNPCPTCFDGSARFLEISVRSAGSGNPYTILSPRQQVTSTPYSIRSLAATAADGLSVTCVNCVTSGQIQNVQGSQVNGAIPVASVPAGSANYVQNTTTQQATSNFNISGTGAAGVFDAATHFNINGDRVLSIGGSGNTFVGNGTGLSNTGTNNSFFGNNAGRNNIGGNSNEFFGSSAGLSNTTGGGNSFFGTSAGQFNTTSFGNSFFGNAAGALTTGGFNSFFGNQTGFNNTTGTNNSFFGRSAGGINTTESNNSYFGFQANGTAGVANSAAIGARAQVTQSNSLVLGSINGINSATADTNVGIGTTAPTQRLHVVGNGLFTGNVTVNGTLTANQLGGIAASGFIQNTTTPQATSNFNISGNGTAGGTLSGNAVNAVTQFNLGGNRVLSAGGNSNLFAGVGAGAANTSSGTGNAFFGYHAGQANINGTSNSFFGYNTGLANTIGIQNAFFGAGAGGSNTNGSFNAFFGLAAGNEHTSGTSNSFFGYNSGLHDEAGDDNTIIGANAGFASTNTIGNENTLLGSRSKVTANLSSATAIGAHAQVDQSNSLVLGSINGVNLATADTSVGIGTTAPIARLHVASGSAGATPNANASLILESNAGHFLNILGPDGSQIGILFGKPTGGGTVAGIVFNASAVPDGLQFRTGGNNVNMVVTSAGDVGIGTTTPVDRLQVAGDIRVGTGTNGCVKDANGSVIAGACSSDARLKRDITPFPQLLDKLARLQPVNFYWRTDQFPERHFGSSQSFGLVAQDVEKVMPELVAEDESGYKVVRYNKLPLLTIQAIKELKAENDALRLQSAALEQRMTAQIEQQREQIEEYSKKSSRQKEQMNRQQQELEILKRIVCLDRPKAELCQARRDNQ